MQRVLVTGGAGFIGSYVIDQLLALGCEVMSFDCLLRQVHPNTPNWPEYQADDAHLTKWFGDVRDVVRAVGPALREFKPDTVIHLAAAVGVGQSAHQPGHYTSTNIGGTAWLLDAISHYNRESDEMLASLEELSRTDDIELQEGETMEVAIERVQAELAPARAELSAKSHGRVERVFIAGSMSSYGEGAYEMVDNCVPLPLALGDSYSTADYEFHTVRPTWRPSPEAWDPPGMKPIPTPEAKPLEPSSIYAWTKEQQESLALLWSRVNQGVRVTIGRFFNTYGSRQALSNPYTGVGAIFSARVAAGAPPVVFEDGAQSRDFTHVSDVARAVLTITAFGEDGEVYNVGTGIPTSILEVARLIAAPAGLEPIVTNVRREGDIRHCYADNSKLRALGWAPKVALADGLAELRAWVEQQPAESAELLDRATQDLVKHGLITGAPAKGE